MRPGPFAFVQFEFGFLIGPDDGRYLVRASAGGEPRLVVVMKTLGAPERRRLRGRRPRTIESPVEAASVPTSRASLISAEPFESGAAATTWLAGLRGDRDALGVAADRAAAELNGVLRAHRAAAADPWARDIAPRSALITRVGYANGEDAAEGRFEKAIELPRAERRKRRAERLTPQESLAAVLSGRESVLAAEELVLRARSDISAGRRREAALQARIALECLLAERPAGRAPKLDQEREPVARAANLALDGDLDDETYAGVKTAVERMAKALPALRLARD